MDAKGVSRLYRSTVSTGQLMLLVAAGLLALLVALWATPVGQAFVELALARWDDIASSISNLFSGD